jgi:hypothetical protein
MVGSAAHLKDGVRRLIFVERMAANYISNDLVVVIQKLNNMNTAAITTEAQKSADAFTKTIVKAWTTQVSRINDLFAAIPDEDMMREIAPGKNTGIYLVGHLAAVHDGMLPLLGFGDKLYPELEIPFIKSPDRSGHKFPSLQELKKCWTDVNTLLTKNIIDLPSERWLERHNSISEEDFAKEPHRNKLSVLISRTTHMSYHQGQLAWLKKK